MPSPRKLCPPRYLNAMLPALTHAPHKEHLGCSPPRFQLLTPNSAQHTAVHLALICVWVFSLLSSWERVKETWQPWPGLVRIVETLIMPVAYIGTALCFTEYFCTGAPGIGLIGCRPANEKCQQLTGRGTGWHLGMSHFKHSEVLEGVPKGLWNSLPGTKEGGDGGSGDCFKCNPA